MEGRRNGEIPIKRYKLPAKRVTNSRAVMHSKAIVATNTVVVFLNVAKRVDHGGFSPENKRQLCNRKEVLANATVVIILQHYKCFSSGGFLGDFF